MFPRNAVTLAPSKDTEAEAIQSSPRFFPVSDGVGEIEEAAGVSLRFSEIRRDKNNPMDHFCGRYTSTTKLSQEFERVKNSSKSRTSV